MRVRKFISYLFIALTATLRMHAQQTKEKQFVPDSIPLIRVMDIAPRIVKKGDIVWQYSGICKTLKVQQFTKQEYELQFNKTKRPLVSVHGNIMYDFLYRSYSDTPYYQRDFQQHTLQSSLSISVKDKYVFRFNLVIRQSNSPWFKNFFDGGLQFDKNAFLTNMKRRLENKLVTTSLDKLNLETIETALKQQYEKLNDTRRFLNRPDLTQLIIEERERIYYQKLKKEQPGLDIKIDSSLTGVREYTSRKKKELDSIQNTITRLQGKADSLKNILNRETALIRKKVYQAKNISDLKKVNAEYGLPAEKQEKFEKFVSNIKSIGIGRSLINYSELTVSNVSLTGFNMEYNPRIYAAIAVGKIDYGFRDFFGRNSSSSKQNLLIGRLGVGDKDKMAVIFSVFTGKKYNYGAVLNDTANSYINVFGYSVEGILKKNENVNISVEVAKSTRPVTGNLRDNKETESLFRFSDQSNQGISIKGQTIIPETNTRLNGFFRKTGENFQSFSLFTYNTDQTAWYLKADQSVVKNRINLVAMLRRNDFTNPFTEKTFKTSTVFTSAQLNVRVPKWPSLSVGYYPGSQLYIINRERVRENVYYIMNGSLVHSYSLLGVRMVTSAIYSRYSNKGTDSGFINYNGATYLLAHSILYRKLQLNGNYILTDQQELKFFTLEANADYSPTASFRIGAGGKYNRTEDGKTYWGGRAQLMLEVKKLGGLQLQYEKSFLPTIYQTLFPVDMGRISWFKYF